MDLTNSSALYETEATLLSVVVGGTYYLCDPGAHLPKAGYRHASCPVSQWKWIACEALEARGLGLPPNLGGTVLRQESGPLPPGFAGSG